MPRKKTTAVTNGEKHIVLLHTDDMLEATFQDLIAKGAKFDLKEASEYDNYSEFAMFIKDALENGKFTKVQFLEALYEDDAEYEYENFKENYGDDHDSDGNEKFVNFIQDEHGPYTAALVCETFDEIYIALVEDCDEIEEYFNMLKELALAITNIHPERIPRKEPSKEVLDIMSKLSTTDKKPVDGFKTVQLSELVNRPTTMAQMNIPFCELKNGVKGINEPMFKKL